MLPPRRWLAALLALALLLPTLALAPPVGAATCTVTSGADSGNGTLRAALARTGNFASQGCETITFAAGLTNIALASYLTIDRAVTIQGPGSTALTVRYVGGYSNLGVVFSIKGGPATLRGLAIADGKASIAAPVGQPPVQVALEEVRVVGNQTSTGAGGGLYASNATLTIANSVFAGNSASGGGSPRQGGGGIFLDDGFGPVSATLTHTGVAGNTATSQGGGIGAVGVNGRAVSLTMQGGSFVGLATQPNTAGSGGGIYATGATLQITGSTIEGNRASHDGGGLYLGDDTGGTYATLTGTAIVGNKATGPATSTENREGGGIAAFATHGRAVSVTLRGSSTVGTAAKPNAADSVGGGIHATNASVSVEDSAVVGNSAPHGAGGIYVSGGTLNLYNGTLAGNSTREFGGGGIAFNAIMTVTNSTISGNTVTSGPGGGFYTDDTSLSIYNSTISGNAANGTNSGDGGGLYISNTPGVVRPSTLTLTIVVGNRAAYRFGGIATSDAQVRLQQSIVAGNTRGGGAAADCTTNAVDWGNNLVGAGGGCPTTAPGTFILAGGALATAVNPTLANNGGPTLTHNVIPGGPAHNKIPAGTCARATDQRGVARPQGGTCDGSIGYCGEVVDFGVC